MSDTWNNLAIIIILSTSLICTTIIADDDVIYTIPQISYGETKHRASRETHHCLEKLDVLLPTPKKNIELSLILATKLIAPKAVVEKHIGNITSAAPLTDNCYYQGKVEGSLKSYAALTRNHGLVSNSYIQPLGE